jgi:amino acid adenylation domain-containing protein
VQIPFVRDLKAKMQRYASRIAVQSRGDTLTYGELLDRANVLRDSIVRHGAQAGDRIALIGNRGVSDYAAILAILLSGCAYVPLNPKAPADRNAYILQKSGAVGILADAENSEACQPSSDNSVRFAIRSDNGADLPWDTAHASTQATDAFDDGAYIIFTSGTTGKPKGVPITGNNLAVYLANLEALFDVTPNDRIAHLSDLSFDLSVHEIFMTWANGAALCCIPQSSALIASRYVEEDGITIWVSVPSTISLAHKAGTLGPDSMRSIRLAFFCGEALSLTTTRYFAEAAPKAEIINLWGPTETTVSFSYFRIDPAQPLPDIIPIGRPYPGQLLDIADADGMPLDQGQIGELLAAGSQVTQGYWQSPELNEDKFLVRDGRRWYRTGDLAVWDERFGYCYKGRVDRQVKIKGHRIELQECESAIREIGAWDFVCVVPGPKSEDGTALGLVAFVCAESVDAAGLKESLGKKLPPYMIPERVVTLRDFPLNANGKVDYKALEGLPYSALGYSFST